MKIVVFGLERRVGALDADGVVDLNKVDSRIPARLDSFIEGGKAVLDWAQAALAKADVDAVHQAGAVKLWAPWPGKRIAMVGGNFADHVAGMNANLGFGGPTTLEGATKAVREAGHWGFWKVPAEVPSVDEEVPFPRYAKYLDYEGEAAVVIGRRGKNIKASEIKDYIWGVTLVNDLSIRDLSA